MPFPRRISLLAVVNPAFIASKHIKVSALTRFAHRLANEVIIERNTTTCYMWGPGWRHGRFAEARYFGEFVERALVFYVCVVDSGCQHNGFIVLESGLWGNGRSHPDLRATF